MQDLTLQVVPEKISMMITNEFLDSKSLAVFSLGTITPASVAAAVGAEQSFLVPVPTPALRVTDIVLCAGGVASGNAAFIAGARVIDATHIGITYANPTAGALVPAAGVLYALVFRP